MEIIEKRDFRCLDQNTQAELRRLAISNFDKGKTTVFIADLLDVNVQTVRDWLRKRKALEERNFQGELRGRKEGEKRILTIAQETEIKKEILENTPEKLKLGSALWTRRKVQELMKLKTERLFPLNTVGNHLYRWGLTAQRPGKVANEQDAQKIKNWIEVEYPKIVELAKSENAIIKFEDETGISLNSYYGKSYALKGKTPEIKLPSKHNKISMISTISIGGTSEFMLYKGALNTELFVDFLERQIRDSKQKIFMIVDNLRVHNSKLTKRWLKRHEKKIQLFFFTSLLSTDQPSRIIKQYLQISFT